MGKEELKARIVERNGRKCGLTQEPLPEITSLFDTHRSPAKVENGEYSVETTEVVDPVAHMKKHWVHRVRTEEMDNLKTICDGRNQAIKVKNKINNQLLAYRRKVDHKSEETEEFLIDMVKPVKAKVAEYSRSLERALMSLLDTKMTEIRDATLSVPSVGPITAAYCLIYLDLDGFYPEGHPLAGKEKCRHASSLWKYVGLDKPSHDRYTKGVAGGGNKTMRSILWNMAGSQIKLNGPYREVYDNVKARLAASEKMTISRNTQGKLIHCMWKDTKPCHRAGAALRVCMKYFLADYWFVGRTILGCDTNPAYAEAQLGKSHRTIQPRERGWIY